ncbi:MAG: outer membrane beta-barrel protein [Muribaculaceae bacterium]|nr:outer membrane beta-barrel protein [Muribaculaceae bacterium]
MRRFFLFFVFMLTLSQVNAIAQDTGDTKPMWGIKAAFDINIPGKWHANGESVKMYEHGFGGTVGALCNIYLGHDFYLEPGASFFYDTYSCGDITLEDSDYSRFTIRPTIYKTGLRVPVVAGYTFDITDRFMMSVFTGPEVNYVIKGGIRGEYNNSNEEDLIESFNPYGEYGMHRKLDCAWKIGLAFPTDYVTLTVDAAIGITDVCKNDISMRENRVSIGLAHYF